MKARYTEKVKGNILVGSALLICFIIAFLMGHYSIYHPSSTSSKLLLSLDNGIDPTLRLRSPSVRTIQPDDPNEPWIETMSWNPRVFLYHNFLSQQECEDIIKLGEESVTRSEVVSAEGNGRVDEYRTSHGLFFTDDWMRKSPLLRDVERRIAEWSHLPVENGEAYYLLRYEVGQYYKPHTDYFSDDDIGRRYIGENGNRYATVITYLQTPTEGGATEFPRASIVIPAKAGDAVLFFDMNPINQGDPFSEHAGLPVTKGIKWALTKWIREKSFYRWDSHQNDEERKKYSNEDTQWRLNHYSELLFGK